MKLKFRALALCQSKIFSQLTYPEEAVDAIPTNIKQNMQLLVHLIKMTPVITPEKNENIQRK